MRWACCAPVNRQSLCGVLGVWQQAVQHQSGNRLQAAQQTSAHHLCAQPAACIRPFNLASWGLLHLCSSLLPHRSLAAQPPPVLPQVVLRGGDHLHPLRPQAQGEGNMYTAPVDAVVYVTAPVQSVQPVPEQHWLNSQGDPGCLFLARCAAGHRCPATLPAPPRAPPCPCCVSRPAPAPCRTTATTGTTARTSGGASLTAMTGCPSGRTSARTTAPASAAPARRR